jgi:hypothetical protein
VEEEDVLEPLIATPKVDSQGEMTLPSCRCNFYMK